jgi:hypothetical protein
VLGGRRLGLRLTGSRQGRKRQNNREGNEPGFHGVTETQGAAVYKPPFPRGGLESAALLFSVFVRD